MTRVIGLGAGGHAKVVIEILRLVEDYEIVGLLDRRKELWNTEVLGVRVLGDDALLEKMHQDGVSHAFIGLGTVGDGGPRRKLFEETRQRGFEIARAIHPRAVISASARIGEGPTIMAGAVVNAAAYLGDHVIINTGATVDHDCEIGNHVHVSAGVNLGGAVLVGESSMLGMGAVVLPGIRIGSNVIVGAGTLVNRDVPDGKVVVGHPGRVVRDNQTGSAAIEEY